MSGSKIGWTGAESSRDFASPSLLSSESDDSSSIYLSARSLQEFEETSMECTANYVHHPTPEPTVNCNNRHLSLNSTNDTDSSSASSCFVDDPRLPSQSPSTLLVTDFTKFLPAPISLLTMPRLLHNEYDPQEWHEAQTALIPRIPFGSRSDTEACGSTAWTASKKGSKGRKTIKKLFSCTKSKTTSPSKDAVRRYEIQHSQNLKCTKIPKISDLRFNYTQNQLFCEVNASPNPQFSAVLYVEMPSKPNINLCHVQTELCVAAMLSFFYPWQNIQFLWKPSFQTFLIDLLTITNPTPKFTRLVYLKHFEAVLVVSPSASHLLRHHNLCFLHSLADTLQINLTRLLVLIDTDTV